MQVSWLALAEGVAQDAKGAITLVGLSQNVLVAPSLPTQTKRVVAAHLDGSGGSDVHELQPATFRFVLKGPQGEVITASSGQMEVGGVAYDDVPGMIEIPSEFIIPVANYGRYTIEFEITFASGKVDSATTSLYVRAPEEGIVAG